MTTSKVTDQNHIQQTLFAVDFLANQSPILDTTKGLQKLQNQVYFTNSCESFAWYAPLTSSWKTWQRSLITDWESYSESWPRQGSIVNGRAYLQVHWEPVTKGNEFGLLPTPCARDHKGPQTKGFKERGYGPLLPDAFTQTGDNMNLNPFFVEEMMGYPVGWTDLKH
jgi:hypothetical protein